MKKSLFVVFVIFIFILGSFWFYLQKTKPSFKKEKEEKIFKKIEFSHFPVDLDLLFRLDKESGDIPISPYHCYFFFTTHIEGAGKWYFKAPDNYPSKGSLVKVYLPAEGKIESRDIEVFGEEITLNGEKVLLDSQVDFDVGSGIEIHFGHLALRKSLKEKVEAEGPLTYKAGTHIGYIFYPSGNHTLDFEVIDENFNAGLTPNPDDKCNKSANPLNYFSKRLKSYLLQKYTPFYEKMKKEGIYPFSDLKDSRANVNIYGTIWGVWFRDDIEGEIGSEVDPAFEAWTIVTLLERNMFHKETFWKILNKKPYISGIMLEEVEGWSPTQRVKLFEGKPPWIANFYIISGNNKEGVAKIKDYYDEKSPFIYLKFKLIENGPSIFDDKLVMEGFSSLLKAKKSKFSKKAVIFRRTPYRLKN